MREILRTHAIDDDRLEGLTQQGPFRGSRVRSLASAKLKRIDPMRN
jgi:hypothetical protein